MLMINERLLSTLFGDFGKTLAENWEWLWGAALLLGFLFFGSINNGNDKWKPTR